MGEKSGDSCCDSGGGIYGKILIAIVAVVAVAYFFSTVSSSTASPEFAQCLTDKGVVMYGTDWCHYCKNQKELFGDSFEYVDYINCDNNKGICELAGVRGYPTWEINGMKYPGVHQLDELAELSGCELEGG